MQQLSRSSESSLSLWHSLAIFGNNLFHQRTSKYEFNMNENRRNDSINIKLMGSSVANIVLYATVSSSIPFDINIKLYCLA